MTFDAHRYPHPDGLRSCRWKVNREVIASAHRFGTNLAAITVWVAQPIPAHPYLARYLRHERQHFSSHVHAIRFATRQARHEQRLAHTHHTRKEPS